MKQNAVANPGQIKKTPKIWFWRYWFVWVLLIIAIVVVISVVST